MSAERSHALLSASSASRWLVCSPSARLEEQFPDVESDYAKEGSLAHEICELKIRQHFVKKQSAATYKKKLKRLQEDPLYEKEMDGYTDEYLDYVSGIVHGFDSPPYIAVEKRLDYSHVVPEGFGTGDCIIIGGDTMHVIDFKYGKGVPVKAEGNPQMKLYAAGALKEYEILYPVEKIMLHIVQPRNDHNNSGLIYKEELESWLNAVVKPGAQQAWNGEGEYRPSEETCRFCRAKATCRARSEQNLELAKEEFKKPPLLSAEEVGPILQKAKDLKAWAADLEEWALKEVLSGGTVPGWKAVEGRSVRKFADQDKAFQILACSGMIEEEMLYVRKPHTLSEIEKMLGKKEFRELLADQVVKPPGKPTLAPEEDQREPITLQTSAEEDFKEE
ncbi:DUF2800 domain-containing protein [Clostridiales Family XIII bacterium ASD5510]|uniref:DUF2800 domain-containing protein n=1 Tax=Hominibacterium faecale TaxID=2839743 RepID=A0A9J6QZ77_9FIRM|nr:DUF2800 domain-containing protein [Hominibacterium faecale]MCU7380830.1 DUF2800 domain-containing protein [Hominibacterium faecale]